jgi:hypothetical protein
MSRFEDLERRVSALEKRLAMPYAGGARNITSCETPGCPYRVLYNVTRQGGADGKHCWRCRQRKARGLE